MANEELAALPRTIRELAVSAAEIGGELRPIKARLFEVVLPCRTVAGVRMVVRGMVGYFVRDGRNHINGAAATRREIAYWGRQVSR